MKKKKAKKPIMGCEMIKNGQMNKVSDMNFEERNFKINDTCIKK
jgi:hypothetical protein